MCSVLCCCVEGLRRPHRLRSLRYSSPISCSAQNVTNLPFASIPQSDPRARSLRSPCVVHFIFPSSSSSELLLLVVVVVACVQFSRRSFWLYPSGSSSHTTLRIELPTVAFYVCATRLQGNSTVSEQLGCFVWVPMGSEAVLKLACCLLKNRNRLGHLVQSTLHDFKVAYYGGVAGVRNRVFLLNHRASTGVTSFLLGNGDGWSVSHIIQST